MKMKNENSLPCGFTLIEVVASVAILAFLLTSAFVAYQRTGDRIIEQILEERALSIAQRQIEMLIASGQEPNSIDLEGIDEDDPFFSWRLDLRRESFGGLPLTLSSPIKATVTVEWEEEQLFGKSGIELTRYYAALDPVSGSDVAVPIQPEAFDMDELPEEIRKILEEAGILTGADGKPIFLPNPELENEE